MRFSSAARSSSDSGISSSSRTPVSPLKRYSFISGASTNASKPGPGLTGYCTTTGVTCAAAFSESSVPSHDACSSVELVDDRDDRLLVPPGIARLNFRSDLEPVLGVEEHHAHVGHPEARAENGPPQKSSEPGVSMMFSLRPMYSANRIVG